MKSPLIVLLSLIVFTSCISNVTNELPSYSIIQSGINGKTNNWKLKGKCYISREVLSAGLTIQISMDDVQFKYVDKSRSKELDFRNINDLKEFVRISSNNLGLFDDTTFVTKGFYAPKLVWIGIVFNDEYFLKYTKEKAIANALNNHTLLYCISTTTQDQVDYHDIKSTMLISDSLMNNKLNNGSIYYIDSNGYVMVWDMTNKGYSLLYSTKTDVKEHINRNPEKTQTFDDIIDKVLNDMYSTLSYENDFK